MENNKILSLLGLAQNGGRISSGEFMTEKSVKEGKAFLVIVAEDASDNTKKNFQDMCNFYHVPLVIVGRKEALGHAIGKQIRASIAVNDSGFAKSIQKLVADSKNNGR